MDISTIFYTFLVWLWSGSCSGSILNVESNQVYTASWAVQLHSTAQDEDARSIANTLGLNYQKILPNNYYLLTDGQNQEVSDKPNVQITEGIKSFSKVTWVEQQVVESFDARSDFSDPLWNQQHHLKPSTTEYKISHRVEEVWSKGYTGKNITVVVIDDGVRGTHRELRNRYDTNVSTAIANGTESSGHGTKCAGVIAAEANNRLCGVGVAYECNIAGIKLFAAKSATDAQTAQAFYRADINPSRADIFSNSWGPSDNGYTIRGPGRLAVEALKHGIEQGRNGLGSIYVFSCGNGAFFDDSCAFDGYVNSIYTIAVASISKDGKVTGYSEPCGAIMTAVYSTNMVTVSNENDNGCVSDFGRTSAAAAFVSGILALALQANRNITWRDMQHLIARSSHWNDVDPSVKRVTNGKQYTVNENFGFGVLDASALINNARNWSSNVPDQVKCSLNVTEELGIQVIPKTFDINVTENMLNCESKLIKSLEHVQLRIDLDYTNRAVLIIDVTSQFGTSSRFVYPRRFDSIDTKRTYNDLVITSVHFWGEPLLGRWSVDVKEGSDPIFNINGNGRLFNMSLVFYGTAELLKENGNRNVRENNTSNDNDNKTDHSKSHKAAVIGGSIAGVCVVIVLSASVAYKLKRRSNPSKQRRDVRQNEQELS